jgi:hypothetical protein
VTLRPHRVALFAFGAVVAISALFGMKGALQDVHWDALIYIARAKQFAETSYLRDYAAEAAQIADELSRWKLGEDTAYWGFIRLGNTILLGVVTALMGANVASIHATFWLYTTLLAASLVVSVLLVLRIAEIGGRGLLHPKTAIIGAIVSAGLYLGSDVYRYLSGNQVSEVPAMLLLAGAALALVEATRSRRIAVAVLSGTLAFLLYVVRVEAIWAYLSFLLLFAAMQFLQRRDRTWMPAAMAAGTTALLLYLAYAWYFWPLADPRLLLTFSAGVQDAPRSGLPATNLLVAAGGPLWIGLLIAVWHGRSNHLTWLAVLWLVLMLLPHADAFLGLRQTEARMYTLIMPALLLGSTVGWATAAQRVAIGQAGLPLVAAMTACALAAIAVSQLETYQLLRQLPGGWRLQYVRQWLSPPNYERLSYRIDELQQISQFVYGRRDPTVLVPEEGRLEENFRIIWYLGPSRAVTMRAPRSSVGALMCRNRVLRPDVEHVVFCTERPLVPTSGNPQPDLQLLYLRLRSARSDSGGGENNGTVFQTASLELVTRPAP